MIPAVVLRRNIAPPSCGIDYAIFWRHIAAILYYGIILQRNNIAANGRIEHAHLYYIDVVLSQDLYNVIHPATAKTPVCIAKIPTHCGAGSSTLKSSPHSFVLLEGEE